MFRRRFRRTRVSREPEVPVTPVYVPSWRPPSGEASAVYGNDFRTVLERTWSDLHRLEEDAGLHHVIDVEAHIERGHDLSTLVKRCLVSSSYVVLKTPSMLYWRPGPDDYLAGSNAGWHMSSQLRAVESAIAAGELHKNAFCIALPETMRVNFGPADSDSAQTYAEEAEAANIEIQALERRVYSVPVGADYAMARRLLRQDAASEPVKTGLLMPALGNLSLADLTKLREEYDGSFARLRFALKRYLDAIDDMESEQKFTHLVEEIDHECRVAEDEFGRIRRKHTRSLSGMVVTSSLVAVAAASEQLVPGAAAAAAAGIGSVSLSQVLSERVKRSDTVDDLARSDFWIAWKLHHENLKRQAPEG